MNRIVWGLALGLVALPAAAASLSVSFETTVGQTAVFKSSLAGVSSLSSGLIVDGNSASGGSAGVFSGFDLDFVFLDRDGNFATTLDRVFATSYSLTTGSIRPTLDPALLPTATRPGPTFGSSALNTIDNALATLDTLDGFYPAPFNTDNVFGWLTLGDGGSLQISFSPEITLTGTEALFIGEVGNSQGEFVNASVSVNVPEPASMALVALALFGLSFARNPRLFKRAHSRSRAG
jgi:hypothetical protein